MTSRAATLYRRHRSNGIQFLKFGLVGGSGVLINGLVTLIMNKLHGGPRNSDLPLFTVPGVGWVFSFSLLVWFVAFFIANLANFQMNRTWTFQSSKHASWFSEYGPFLLVGAVAAIVGAVLKAWMKSPGNPLYLPSPLFHEDDGLHSREYWSQIIAVLLTVPINYVVNKLWTFRAVRTRKPGEDLPMVAPAVAPEIVDEHGEPLDAERRPVTHSFTDSTDTLEAKG